MDARTNAPTRSAAYFLLEGLIYVLEANGRHVVISNGFRLDLRMEYSFIIDLFLLDIKYLNFL